MSAKAYDWQRVAESPDELDFSNNNIAVVEVKDKKICVGRHDGKYFGFAYKCPHAGGILADGYIDVLGNVVCPLHRYKYSMENGRNTSGEGYYLKNWPVELRPDGLWIGLEPGGSFWNIFR